MKVVILAGGFGTRIAEESHTVPKPMIEIGGRPILWHIMKSYSAQGFNDFVICCGYKQHVIKEFFANYYLHTSDVTFDFANDNKMIVHNSMSEPWKVTLVDTGLNTMTGGRVRRIKEYIGNEPFMLTYGDSVSDVDFNALLSYHKSQGRKATLTAVHAGQRFGVLGLGDNGDVAAFREKRDVDGSWINGGFMVLEPEVFDLLIDDTTVLEQKPMETLAETGELSAFRHSGFWHCMDTLRDRQNLEAIWASGDAPWKRW